MLSKLLRNFDALLLDSAEYIKHSLPIFGLMGIISHAIYYVLWSHYFEQPYENLPLRIASIMVLLCFVFVYHLPEWTKKNFHRFFFLAMAFLVPFFFFWMTSNNQFNLTWFLSLAGGLFVGAIILNHWLLSLLNLALGLLFWFLTYFFYPHTIYEPSNEIIENLIIYLLVFIFTYSGMLIFNYIQYAKNKSLVNFLHALGVQFSHENKTPLLSIQAISTLIMNQIKNNPSEYNARIKNSILEIQKVVERSLKFQEITLMNFSRNNQKLLPYFNHLSMHEIIQEAINSYPFGPLQEGIVRFEKNRGPDFIFFGSDALMVHIIHNLLKNAFSALMQREVPKKTSTITIWTAIEKSTGKLFIEDNGRGVKKSDIKTLFENFMSHNKKTHNTGIGLNFCQQSIHLMKGDISCMSEYGKYTQFCFSLPISERTSLKKQHKPQSALLVTAEEVSETPSLFQHKFFIPHQAQKAEDFQMAFFIFPDTPMTNENTLTLLKQLQLSGIEVIGLYQNAAQKPHFQQQLFKEIKHYSNEAHLLEILERYLPSEVFLDLVFLEVSKHHLQGKSLLLVDDDQIHHIFMRNLLSPIKDLQFSEATRTTQALQILAKKTFDILLLDWHLSDATGFQIAKQLINNHTIKPTQIIFATASDHPDFQHQASTELHIHSFVTKPIKYQQIIEHMMMLLFFENHEQITNNPPEWLQKKQQMHPTIISHLQELYTQIEQQNQKNNIPALQTQITRIIKIAILLGEKELFLQAQQNFKQLNIQKLPPKKDSDALLKCIAKTLHTHKGI